MNRKIFFRFLFLFFSKRNKNHQCLDNNERDNNIKGTIRKKNWQNGNIWKKIYSTLYISIQNDEKQQNEWKKRNEMKQLPIVFLARIGSVRSVSNVHVSLDIIFCVLFFFFCVIFCSLFLSYIYYIYFVCILINILLSVRVFIECSAKQQSDINCPDAD